MVSLKALADYTDSLLSPDSYSDYCPNGLQVQGRAEVHSIASGVTASLALIEAAIEVSADALVVHHGYFWKGEDARITVMKLRRLERLLGSGTSLLAYHLPLDAHPELGNNAQLAQVLGFTGSGAFGDDAGMQLGRSGTLEQPLDAAALAEHIRQRLGRAPLHIDGGSDMITRVGWCTDRKSVV